MTPISIFPQSLRLLSPPSPLLISSHLKTKRTPSNPIIMTSWLKQTLGQRFNPSGISSFTDVISRDPQLALPHLTVPDIRHLDWAELRRLGFQGVVFDKDNTLTAPYSLSLWPSLVPAFELCRSAFPGKIAVFSNSAGLYQYDPDGKEARALEEAIGGVHVIRH
ncbi:uncharacterized protein LOC109828585, partial [Asparagus officinalis]